MDAGVRPCHTGDSQAHGFDPTHVMPRTIHVIENLWYAELTTPDLPQFNQGVRADRQQRYMLGNLVLPSILFQVARIHPLQVEVEPLSGHQAFLQTIPIAVFDETGVWQSQLEAIRALGALRHLVSQLICAEINARNLPDHPRVQLLVGVLLSHGAIHVLGIRDLLIMILQFALGDLPADLIGDYLFVNLFQFLGGKVGLKTPFVMATLISTYRLAKA